MKKVLMTLAVAFIAVAANAQVYVGGNVGIGSSKSGDADAVTTYKVLPEIGSVLKPSCKPTSLKHTIS